MEDLSKFSFNKQKQYGDEKYSFYTISVNDSSFRRIDCEKEGICLLPFETNDHNQIKNVYLFKYYDYLKNSSGFSCISLDINPDEDSSYFQALIRSLNKELGLKEIDINAVFYIGKLNHTLPFSKQYHCYAINLSNIVSDPNGFTPKLSDEEIKHKLYTIEKVNFNRVLKGEVSDSLTLGCSLLLLSYFK